MARHSSRFCYVMQTKIVFQRIVDTQLSFLLSISSGLQDNPPSRDFVKFLVCNRLDHLYLFVKSYFSENRNIHKLELFICLVIKNKH